MIKAQLIGRIGKDATVYNFDGGGAAINFSVAIDESYKDKQGQKVEKTTWVECTILVKEANSSTHRVKYLKKGCVVYVEGKPVSNGYKDMNGEFKHGLKFIVSNCQNITWPEKENEPAKQEEVFATNGPTDDLPF